MPDITIKNENDIDFTGYIAMPKPGPEPGPETGAAGQKVPAIIVIQEIFGVNAVMRQICDDWAAKGYIAICPDLFWRIEPKIQITDKTDAEWQKAFELFGKFDVDKGVEDLQATLNFIRNHESCDGKVSAIGFCLGGKLAYLMAARTDIDASVGYYGVEIDKFVAEKENIKKPTLLHIAEMDEFVDKDAQKIIKAELADHPFVSLHFYEGADHAFAREGGAHYDETHAKTANARTDTFLQTYLNQNT